MPTPVFTPKSLTWLGVAKEAVWGTAVPPTFWPPFKDVKPEDVIEYVKDQGIRGAMAQTFNVMPGPMHSTFEVDGEVFPDIIGLFSLATLGKDTVTGTGPYIHSFALHRTAQPVSLTHSYYDGTSERQFAGHMVEELSFKWAANAALEYTVKSQGLTSATTTVGTPTPSTTIPFMSWAFNATLGGVNRALVGFDISLKRKLYVQHAANNTQAPTAIISGPLEVTGKATFDKQDDTELSDFLQNTQPTFVLTGAQSGTGYGIVFQMSKCAFLKDPITAKEVVQGDVEWEGIDNGTDNGPCLIKITNGTATY